MSETETLLREIEDDIRAEQARLRKAKPPNYTFSILLAVALTTAVAAAAVTLLGRAAGRASDESERTRRYDIMVQTATALAPGADTSLNWNQPAGQIVLAAYQEQDPTPSPTLAPMSAPTLPPTATPPGPTLTPSPLAPTEAPTVIYVIPPTQPRPTVAGLFEDYAAPAEPPATAIPTRMSMADNRGEDIMNILLVGLDTHPDRQGSRSDTIIVVSVNRTAGTVNMLSIPRDTFVYIPGWTMQRINTAIPRGDAVGWTGGGGNGIGLLRDTLLYNFGIPIHFYARVDFDSFRAIVDAVGGVEVAVDCAHQDWILKEPGLDEQDEDNWELFTLPIGVQQLDGHTALWYARSRRRTSDFDRSRRQQMILRAMFSKAQSQGLLNQVPVLWEQFSPYVETDMTLADILGLVPTALQLDGSRVQSLVFNQWYLTSWTTPDGDEVLLPVPERIELMVQELYLPPTSHTLVQEAARIEILDGSGNPDWGVVAAARLEWEGFTPTAGGAADEIVPDTIIYDYTGQTKGSSVNTIAEVLNVHPNNIIVEPNPERTVDFRVILGATYNSCTYNVPDPVPTPTPEPEG